MSDSRSGGTDWALTPPSFSEMEEAAGRLKGQAVITPLVENHDLNAEVGSRIFVKAEMLQRTGPSSSAAPMTASGNWTKRNRSRA